jgi:hypothetical protein
MNVRRIDRRTFLKTTAAGALAFPMVRAVFCPGQSRNRRASERVTMGSSASAAWAPTTCGPSLGQPDVQCSRFATPRQGQ